MNFKKTAVSVAMATSVGLGASTASAITLTFSNNTNPAAFGANPDTDGGSNLTALPANNEFRMIDPTGAGGGGPPQPAKDVITGGETWTFCGNCFDMIGVGGTPTNPGAGSFPGSAAPSATTNPTLHQPANFFFQGFNFLAPTTGSLAGAPPLSGGYGPGTISASFTSTSATNGTMTINMPTAEAQWAGVWFPLGQNFDGTDTAGVTFTGNVTCAVGGINCSFRIQAQETINVGTGGGGTGINEDPSAAGFGNWTAQWDLVGTVDNLSAFHVVPVPAAVWLFGSGLLGLVGVARRRKA